jgi:hypothetical protein
LQRTLNQPSPLLVHAFRKHVIRGERRLSEQSRAQRDALLCDFDPVRISLREQFHDRPPRVHEVGSTVLNAAERAQLAASSR